MFKNEEGFSLLELSIAAAVAVAIGAVAVTTTTAVIEDSKTAANNYQSNAQGDLDIADNSLSSTGTDRFPAAS